MNYITEYYNKISSGEILACKKILQVYQHLQDKISGKVNDGYHFDESKANRPIEFIERFCHLSKGAKGGQLFKLELFQKALVSAIFGFVDSEGIRQFKRVLICQARKNGKTQLLSALALFLLVADGENTPYLYSVATKKEIAKLAWDECARTIKKSPQLRNYCKCRVGDIVCSINSGIYKPLASDSNSMDGLDGSFLMDEIHAWQDQNLYNVCADAISARKQPLILITTTSGFVRNGIYDSLYKQAEDVLEGYVGGTYKDDAFLPIVYEIDEKLDWQEPTNWIKANPGLGVIKDYKQLAEKVQRAKAGNEDLNNMLTKEFNFPAAGAKSYLSWDIIRNQETFNLKDLLQEETYYIGSFDLSKYVDLSAANCLFKLASKPDVLYCISMSWITEDALEKNNDNKIPYRKWIEQGYMRVCAGNIINYTDILQWFKELQEQGLYMYKCGYDSYSANQLIVDMKSEYGDGCLEKVIQGARSLSLPLEYLKQQLEAKNIVYGNNPCLQWQLANLQIISDTNGNLKPTKNRNLELRNDAAMALLDGLAVYLRYTQEYSVMIDGKN